MQKTFTDDPWLTADIIHHLSNAVDPRRTTPVIVINDSDKLPARSVRGHGIAANLTSTYYPAMDESRWSTRDPEETGTELKLSCITVKSETKIVAQLSPRLPLNRAFSEEPASRLRFEV